MLSEAFQMPDKYNAIHLNFSIVKPSGTVEYRSFTIIHDAFEHHLCYCRVNWYHRQTSGELQKVLPK